MVLLDRPVGPLDVEVVSEDELREALVEVHCANISEAMRRAREDGARIWVRGHELKLAEEPEPASWLG